VDQAESLVDGRVGRHLTGGAPEQRQLAQGHDRADLVPDRADDQFPRLPAAFGHVHVRVGVEAEDGRSCLHAPPCVVAVQVEGGHDRTVRPDLLPHRLDEVAVAVVDALDHHRPVQVEQHAVHRAVLPGLT